MGRNPGGIAALGGPPILQISQGEKGQSREDSGLDLGNVDSYV